MQVVDADGVAQLDILDSLVERKVGAEEANQNVAPRPVLHICASVPESVSMTIVQNDRSRDKLTFAQDDLLPEYFNLDTPPTPFDESCDDLAHRL